MIGKLGEDEKADWPSHLAEIVHTYNTTHSTVMEYSPHFLMSGCWPRLLVDFYFTTLRSTEVPRRGTSTRHVNKFVATVTDHLRTALHEAQAQSTAEDQRQTWYCDQKIGVVGLKPGNLILVKADAFWGKRKIQGQIGGQASWGSMSDHDRHPLIWSERPAQKYSCVLYHKWLLLIASEAGIPLCTGVHQAQDGCTSPTPVKPTAGGSDSKKMPQEDDGLAITQHQTRKTSLGWRNGKLWFFPWM